MYLDRRERFYDFKWNARVGYLCPPCRTKWNRQSEDFFTRFVKTLLELFSRFVCLILKPKSSLKELAWRLAVSSLQKQKISSTSLYFSVLSLFYTRLILYACIFLIVILLLESLVSKNAPLYILCIGVTLLDKLVVSGIILLDRVLLWLFSCILCCGWYWILDFLMRNLINLADKLRSVKKKIPHYPESPDCIVVCEKAQCLPGPGEVYFRLKKTEKRRKRWNDWTYKKDLIPALVKKALKMHLQQAGKHLSLTMNFQLKFEDKESGTAITCALFHPELTCLVKLDFTPVLLNIAPFHDSSKWDDTNVDWSDWPNLHTIEKMKNLGVSLVPKSDFHWKMSTAMLEVELMINIRDDPHTNGCRRKSHRILKKLNEQFFCNTTKPVISSYALKSILFMECEEFPNDSDWENSRLTERIISMTKKLLESIKEGNIENYVCREINVLHVKNFMRIMALTHTKQNIQQFLHDPDCYMKKINSSQNPNITTESDWSIYFWRILDILGMF